MHGFAMLSHCRHTLALVILGFLLTPCGSAPAPTTSDWWFNPCNDQVARLRHVRSPKHTLTHIRLQYSVFFNELSKATMDIEQLYQEPAHQNQTSRKLTWFNVNKMVKTLRKNTKKPIPLIREFRLMLQAFARMMKHLSEMKVRTDLVKFPQQKRDKIYFNITNHLRNLLCEVHEVNSVANKKETPPSSYRKYLRGLKAMSESDKVLDLTMAHMIDVNFFSQMKRFFRRSMRHLGVPLQKKTKKNRTSVKVSRRTKM